MAKRTCTVEDCNEPHHGRGFCRAHYYQMRRDGKGAGGARSTLEQRFWSKVDKNGPLPVQRPELGNCWVWISAKHDLVYGMILVDTPPMKGAHRVGYELMVGPIPDGLVLDHLCRRPRCVRYDHVEPVPQPVNIARGEAPALLREWDAKRRGQTHCKYGHEFTPENTRVRRNGRRACRACGRARFSAWRKRPDVREQQNAYYREYYAKQKARRVADRA
jgi:hypothetical protein